MALNKPNIVLYKCEVINRHTYTHKQSLVHTQTKFSDDVFNKEITEP